MKSTWCISDVHACADEFFELLERIAPTEEDDVYVLGDLVDRGPKPVEVLNFALKAPKNFHFLLGNHDLMMRKILKRDPDTMPMRMDDLWSINGGYDTAEQLYEMTSQQWREYDLLPFLNELVPYTYVETDSGPFMLVHAGFDMYENKGVYVDVWQEGPDYEVGHGYDTQNEFVMCWVRKGWFNSEMSAPITTVFGHTPTKYMARMAESERQWYDMNPDLERPDFLDNMPQANRIWRDHNRIAIDCGCAYSGALAAIRLEDGEEIYVQAKD